MAKKPTLNDVVNILNSSTTINNNNSRIETAFENTLSRDGSTPNSMEADLDMNGNDLINLSGLDVETLRLNGQLVSDINSFVPMWKGDWVTATVYNSYDLVKNSGNSYICLVGHTSVNFVTDLAGGLWELFVEKGDSGAGSGDMLAVNNLSDVADAETARNNIGVEIGVTVQAYNNNLSSLSGLTLQAGDVLYATGAGTLVRLGKGSANSVFSMNSGATAPEWRPVSDTINITSSTSAIAFDVPTGAYGFRLHFWNFVPATTDCGLVINMGKNGSGGPFISGTDYYSQGTHNNSGASLSTFVTTNDSKILICSQTLTSATYEDAGAGVVNCIGLNDVNFGFMLDAEYNSVNLTPIRIMGDLNGGFMTDTHTNINAFNITAETGNIGNLQGRITWLY